jgi:hypothetical protein
MIGPKNDAKRPAAVKSLEASARRLLEADDDAAVVVNELTCMEPGCPPIETVVALLKAGSAPCQAKVQKPLLDVTEDDPEQAAPARRRRWLSVEVEGGARCAPTL